MNADRENGARKRQKGQSIIEVSLMTPLLLIALYVPADFGIAFFMSNLTQTAAREGARIGSTLQKSVEKSGPTVNVIFSAAEANTIKTEVSKRMPGYLSNKTVTVTFYTGSACMEFLEVTAQGQYNFSLYRLMRLFGAPAPETMTISRTTQMHYRYQPYTNHEYCTGPLTYGPYSL